LPDETNSEWDITLKMKIAASHSGKGLEEGIHWHINPAVKIEYVALDDKLQEIPWVKYTNVKTGEEKIYTNQSPNFSDDMLNKLTIHKMDCIDCHNRPSHIYNPPAIFVNEAISSGAIPLELPEIKNLTMEICSEEFNSTDTAMMYIETTIKDFYDENYPELVAKNPGLISKAIFGFKEIYNKNIFAEMKVRWDAYPNNIGHLEFNGCFRCHSNEHTSDNGDIISKDCNLCHTILAQGNPSNMQSVGINESIEFVHPEDIGDDWKESLCIDCHTGLNP
jgi:hypothetical protein